MKQSNNRTTMI